LPEARSDTRIVPAIAVPKDELVVLAVLALVDLAAAIFLPAYPEQRGAPTIAPDAFDTATQRG
jgi:hypothetical protein